MENLGPDIFGGSEATQSQPADSLVNMANPSVIKVVGVGGGGGNAIKRMIKAGLTGVEFWEMNTPEMTDEVKRELEILSMRGYWDPKSFFKVSNNPI